MVRKSTIHRNPIGSTSEALHRQRSRQSSLRRQIMNSSLEGLTMNTETLLEFNPKLAEVSHTTRIAYAKFMTSKLKKEIKFENDKIQIENEKDRARETKAFNKFKMNAGILKKTVEQASETKPNEVGPQTEPIVPTTPPSNEGTSKDFRARTPIEEDPYEDAQSTDRSLTPENILDEPIPEITSPPVPSQNSPPPPSENRKADSPIVKMKSASMSTPERVVKSPEPPSTKTPDLSKTEEADEKEEEDEVKQEPETLKTSSQLNVPSPPSHPISPSISTGDKGKSKITGKTLTGWI